MTNTTKRRVLDAFVVVWGFTLIFAATMGDSLAAKREEARPFYATVHVIPYVEHDDEEDEA